MDYTKLIEELKEEGISEEKRAERLKLLQELVKSQNQLYDDHGSYIIGDRNEKSEG